MTNFEELQLIAMAAAVEPDNAAGMRQLFRIYSKTFSTPLHEVADLPIDDVVLAVLEERYSEMDEGDRLEIIEWLTSTPEERAEMERHESGVEAKDDEFLNNLNQEVAEDQMRGLPKVVKPPSPVLENEAPLPAGLAAIARKVARANRQAEKEVSLPAPKPKEELPEINIKFSDDNLKSSWDQLDPLAIPRKKP